MGPYRLTVHWVPEPQVLRVGAGGIAAVLLSLGLLLHGVQRLTGGHGQPAPRAGHGASTTAPSVPGAAVQRVWAAQRAVALLCASQWILALRAAR